MAKPELIGAKTDERLEYLLTSVKEGVRIFANAIRNSPEDSDIVAFRAFTLKSKSKEEVEKMVADDMTVASEALPLLSVEEAVVETKA